MRRLKVTPGPYREVSGAVETEEGIGLALMNRDESQTRPTERDDNAKFFASIYEYRRLLAKWVEYGRNHTSPTDPNTPHQLLVDSFNLIDQVDDEFIK